MTMVPHSGNLCSGLCRQPCKHADCWQCNEGTEAYAVSQGAKVEDARAVSRLNELAVAAESATKEDKAKAKLRAAGATDADIAAVAKLAGYTGSYSIDPEVPKDALQSGSVLTADMIRQAAQRIGENAAAEMDRQVMGILNPATYKELVQGEFLPEPDTTVNFGKGLTLDRGGYVRFRGMVLDA